VRPHLLRVPALTGTPADHGQTECTRPSGTVSSSNPGGDRREPVSAARLSRFRCGYCLYAECRRSRHQDSATPGVKMPDGTGGILSTHGRGAMRVAVRRSVFILLRLTCLPLLVRRTLQRRRLTILCFHDIDPKTLDQNLRVLGRSYNFVGLRGYLEARDSGRLDVLPPRSLVVTLDDGFAIHRELLDTFRSHSVTPTVFLCSGVVGTDRRFWWTAPEDRAEVERLKRIPDDERIRALASINFSETAPFSERSALSRAEIDEMREVFDFQAHSIFHPILTNCSDQRSWAEISGCKRQLEDEFGLDVYAFAYPNGDLSDREVEFVKKAGYRCGVTTRVGLNDSNTDLYRLRRVGMDDTTSVSEIIVRASGLAAYLKGLFRLRRSSAPAA
jgi:poly-beta-1,6-N-acetyl-D-glucosamine N-deacetylase